VTVTRRHHPLHGQALDVAKRGRTQIVVRLRDGTTMRSPCAWTDVGGPPNDSSEAIFTDDALRAVLDLVDALRARDRLLGWGQAAAIVITKVKQFTLFYGWAFSLEILTTTIVTRQIHLRISSLEILISQT
jgi:hypothetical protein